MALTPRPLSFSGLQRLGRAEAPAMPTRQREVQALPVTGGNAGALFEAASGALGQAAGQFEQIRAGEEQASLAAALSRSEAVLDTTITEIAAKHEADHQGFGQAAAAAGQAWVKTLPAPLQQQAETLVVRHVQGHTRQILATERQRLRDGDQAELLGRADKELDSIMAAARSGDGQTLNDSAAAFEGARQSLFAAGMITPQQFVAMGRAKADGAERQQALRGFDVARGKGLASAEAYLSQFEAGGVSPEIKDPDQRAKIVFEMNRYLSEDRAEYRAAAAAHDKTLTEQFGVYRQTVGVAAEAVLKGRDFAGFESLKTETRALAATDPKRYGPLVQALDDAERLAGTLQEFSSLHPQDQAAAIDGSTVASATDNNLVDGMEQVQRGTAAALQADPHGWAATHLGDRYQSPPLAMGDILGFTDSLQKRSAATGRLTAWNKDQPVPFLRPGEAEALRDRFNTMAPGDQALYLHAINQNAPAYAGSVYQALGKDAPVLAHIGGLTSLGPQHHGPAEMALAGLQTEGIDLPADDDLLFSDAVGSAFAAAPKSRAAVKEVADAIYRGQAVRRGLGKNNEDPDLYATAVQLAMGQAQNGAGQTTGGLTEINGVQVPVPPGMTARAFTDFTERFLGPDGGAQRVQMSLNGKVPPKDSTGHEYDPAIDKAWLVASVAGTYFLSMTDPADGPVFWRGDGQAGLYELDLSRLPRTVR